MIEPLLGIWQFCLIFAFGLFLARYTKLELPYGYHLAFAFGLGEMVVSYSFFLLGLAGGLRFWVLVPLAVVGSGLCLPGFLREMNRLYKAARPSIRQAPWVSVCVFVMILLYVISACTPEREVDSVWYHLGVPLYYITHGGFIQLVPFNMPSHYPMNIHLHYCFSLLIGNETTAKFFILCHFIPLFLLLWAVCARYIGRRWGLVAILIFCCCLHFRVPVMANVQRAIYFYVLLSTALLWLAVEQKTWKLLIWASVFCGMAMGTKFNGLLFGYAAQWIFLGIVIFVFRVFPLWEGIQKWCAHSLIGWGMMSPWLIKSYIYTNNPFYPMLGEVFSTKTEFRHAMLSNAKNHGLNILKSHNAAEFFGQVAINLKWFMDNTDLIFFLGALSVVILLTLRRKDWIYPLLSGVIAYCLFPMMWGCDIARLFAVNYGIVILLICMMLSWIVATVPRYHSLPGVILFCLLVTFFYQRSIYIKNAEIPWQHGVYLSEQARREWLEQQGLFSQDYFKMGDYIKEHIPAEDELYGYRTGYLFYFYRKTIVCGAHFGEQMDKWLLTGPSYTRDQLTKLHVKWILTHYRGLPYDEVLKPAWEKFADQYLEPAHREGEATLYRLR